MVPLANMQDFEKFFWGPLILVSLQCKLTPWLHIFCRVTKTDQQIAAFCKFVHALLAKSLYWYMKDEWNPNILRNVHFGQPSLFFQHNSKNILLNSFCFFQILLDEHQTTQIAITLPQFHPDKISRVKVVCVIYTFTVTDISRPTQSFMNMNSSVISATSNHMPAWGIWVGHERTLYSQQYKKE